VAAILARVSVATGSVAIKAFVPPNIAALYLTSHR
jgi:hypothetical protein